MKCRACLGKGWLVFKDDELQRCDECQKYKDDLNAAVAFFASRQRKFWLDRIVLKRRPK